MIELGKMNLLEVKSIKDKEIVLYDPDSKEEAILCLEDRENKEGIQGLCARVFVDRDAEGRLKASLKRPDIVIGEIRRLKVVDITDVGVFLDWGLSHDLFLPHKNHRTEIRMDEEPLVMLTVNPKGRISATTEIYKHLQTGAPYQKGDLAKGTIYQFGEDLGAWFIAIDDCYHGMIPRDETIGEDFQLGEVRTVRIKRVRADGKLDCTPRKKAYQSMDEDAERILAYLERKGGFMTLHDKSSPDEIQGELGMSKASFKRALGRLYKNALVTLEKDGVRKN